MPADQMGWCENCGYEVEASGRCHACVAPLLLSPLASRNAHVPGEGVGYRFERATTSWARPQCQLFVITRSVRAYLVAPPGRPGTECAPTGARAAKGELCVFVGD